MLKQGKAGMKAAGTCVMTAGWPISSMWHLSWSARQRRSLTAECVLVRLPNKRHGQGDKEKR